MDLEALGLKQNWKEFEVFIDQIFVSFGFQTIRNYRLKKPAMEIDLVASRYGTAFAIDCKYWKRTAGYSAMDRISRMQIARAKRILESGLWSDVIPMIMTLRDESLFILENGVPVVPLRGLSDFLLNWEGSKENLLHLSTFYSQTKIR